MKFSRKDNNTGKWGFLAMTLIGLGAMYAGYSELSWAWNFLVMLIGGFMALIGYQNYKKANSAIAEIGFQQKEVTFQFVDGEQKQIKQEKLVYAILVKRSHQPVKAIEFIEKGKIPFTSGKKIGELRVSKWPQLENIAKYLIVNEYERKSWRFSWTFGELLMLFGMLLGATEGIAGNYIEEINSGIPHDTISIGESIDDEEERIRDSHRKSEQDFIEKTRNSTDEGRDSIS
ncbi:MAG: hypothetical protein AAGI38_10210 [Bacteroidota bacterium]